MKGWGYPRLQRGLSPRVRGNLMPHAGGWGTYRSIPASAGQPDGIISVAHDTSGLSPRVRGNLLIIGIGPIMIRSIPASAGQPATGYGLSPISEVYPRECGATLTFHSLHEFLGGLSPRVRGNPSAARRPAAPVGSIPASAGQPMARISHDRWQRSIPASAGQPPSAANTR